MEQTFGLLFFLKKNKGKNQLEQIIYLRITSERKTQ